LASPSAAYLPDASLIGFNSTSPDARTLQGSVDSRREQALERGIEKLEMGALRQDQADIGNEVMNEHSMNVLSK